MFTRKQKFFVGCSFLLIALPQYAFAYVDPGTGSYILQILLAGIIGIPFIIKSKWNKIISFFKNKKS
ncbi:hypothetical protein L9W92_01075 [Pelotomaculum terephthalicicum JT]|uniref:hypothetical protein n=1 Tax=Pelotomaculum terephthalicicum TaxID=206393 RepID=UPI001F042A82|nr:hypothetical protein [Pelotomaculum terephthalicicum]MCG9966648.1 hypothetical protein [Pelotomaculum terephthalicicum JT]